MEGGGGRKVGMGQIELVGGMGNEGRGSRGVGAEKTSRNISFSLQAWKCALIF